MNLVYHYKKLIILYKIIIIISLMTTNNNNNNNIFQNENNESYILIRLESQYTVPPYGEFFSFYLNGVIYRDNHKDIKKLYRSTLERLATLLSIKHKGIKKSELIVLLSKRILFE